MAFSSPNVASAHTQSPVSAHAVEKTVRAYYADIPVLIKIAQCESKFRQYNEDGSPLRNEKGSSAVGVMQIISSLHSGSARHMGLNLNTLEGNLAYARHLYQQQGTTPWNASRGCWKS